jgi:hypothetical protein
VATAVRLGRVDRTRLLFATNAAHARRFPEVLAEIRKLEALRRVAALFRSHAASGLPEGFAGRLRGLLAGETVSPGHGRARPSILEPP